MATYSLVLDSETTGVPDDQLPREHPSQPKLVQLAAILFGPDDKELAMMNVIIRPDGWIIPDAMAKIHGITTQMAMDVGIRLRVACLMFSDLLAGVNEFVAHNLKFDQEILEIAYRQAGEEAGPDWAGKAPVCTQELSAPILNLPPTQAMIHAGRGGQPKSPKLAEAYEFFTGTPMVGAHNGLPDARACHTILRYIRQGGAS